MYRRILIPTDGSTYGDHAVTHGVRLARALGSRVVFLFVADPLTVLADGVTDVARLQALRSHGQDVLDRAASLAASEGVEAESLLTEDRPSDAILRASDRSDLVVMSSHGKSFLRRVFAGSVTEAVLHHIACPVLLLQCDRTLAEVPAP